MARIKDFDPNMVTVPAYATFVESRTPQFKVHKNRGHALNTFPLLIANRTSLHHFWFNSAIYHYELDLSLNSPTYCHNQWKEIYRVEHWIKPSCCENCNVDLMQFNPKAVNIGHTVWFDCNTDRPKIGHVCKDCLKGLK